MEPRYKVRTTDTHVYFLTGPFSQWHPSVFHQGLDDTAAVLEFSHAEQYMMAGKAMLFGDYDALNKIMSTDDPSKQKAIGRTIKNFDLDLWNQNARRIVYQGNLAKFTSDPSLKEYLLATGNRHLVEGAAYDRVWGVGLAWDDNAILAESNWQGTNWLGETLMAVRKTLTA